MRDVIRDFLGPQLRVDHRTAYPNRRRGVRVTAEVTPHHLLLTDVCCSGFDPSKHKMNPPLRTEEDRLACIAGLQDGTIEAIASDHAPHRREEKEREWSLAPNGIIGLETTLPIVITAFPSVPVIESEVTPLVVTAVPPASKFPNEVDAVVADAAIVVTT